MKIAVVDKMVRYDRREVQMKRIISITVIMILILSGCSSDKIPEQQEKTPEGYPDVHPMVQNMAFQEQEDGWIYYMSIQYFKTDQESASIKGNYDIAKPIPNFDGINLKYKELENAYIPVIDSETKEEISQGTASIPTLTVLQSVKDEVKTINTFLQDKNFIEPITLADLDGLTCDSFDKQVLVDLYNQALKNIPESFGMFAQLPAANLLQVKDTTGRTWQGGYIGNYGTTGIVRFECIQDKKYFSDKIEAGTADETQLKIQANRDQMEMMIMETQVFSIDHMEWTYPEVMDEQITTSLQALLQKLYTGAKN